MRSSRCSLVEDFEAEFLDDGVGEHVLGDALDLSFGFLAAEAVELQHEEFALADVLHLGIARATRERVGWFAPADREPWISA